MIARRSLRLFEAVGIEIEYMIVDAQSLDVRPIADRLFARVLGIEGSDVEGDLISWSNELVAHVVELKTTEPARSVESMVAPLQAEVDRINRSLHELGARLLPTAMHPWMDPRQETRLWPGENNEIYQAFDRIFGCKGHGWSNLQSMHLNLPFASNEEFARLHSAIRLVVPLIPALAASSPFEEGIATGWLDNRMKHYRRNSAKLPSVAGGIVPEPVASREEYDQQIFAPMFAEIAPHDPEEQMREEWLNARGAIARFGRGSIEIRVIDSQECVAADLAVASAVMAVVRALAEDRWASTQRQRDCEQSALVELLSATSELGPMAKIDDPNYLACLGFPRSVGSAGEVWEHLVNELRGMPAGIDSQWIDPLEQILRRGPLALRIRQAAGDAPDRAALHSVYQSLAQCLSDGVMFLPD